MFSCPEHLRPALAALALLLATASAGVQAQTLSQTPTPAQSQPPYPGVGRPATPQEVAAWDIDVRPDFKGLPKGSGSVAKGQEVWEAKCASCHGVFGESNEVFAPLVGGTSREDMKSGRVARLNDVTFPGRTTLMKVSSLSTVWDYINRAMPWNAPKTLSTEEVYALTAYMLNMGGVLPDSFVLSDNNIADVQKLLPNRNGVTTDHGLWPGKGMGNGGKPDVRAVACMKDCETEPKLSSFLPDFARNNHGNLAQQQRPVGPQRGADTTRPAPANAAAAAAATAAAASATQAGAQAGAIPAAGDSNRNGKNGNNGGGAAALALAQKHSCTACHGMDNKIVGPGLKEIATRYAARADAEAYIAGKIRAGSQGVWGAIPMPPQSLPDKDLKALAAWLAGGAQR